MYEQLIACEDHAVRCIAARGVARLISYDVSDGGRLTARLLDDRASLVRAIAAAEMRAALSVPDVQQED